MSVIKDLVMDIRDMLEADMTPRQIAQVLEVPVSFVYEAIEANFFDDDVEDVYYGA